MPGRAQRYRVEAFGLEQTNRRFVMLATLANTTTPSERTEQLLALTPIDRSELQPLLENLENFRRFTGQRGDELLENGDVAGAKPPTLRDEPARELWIAVQLERVEKLSAAPGG